MKIDTHLQPNCSESSWRLTGPKDELTKIEKEFLSRMKGSQHTEWINETLLLQTTDQSSAGAYYQEDLKQNKKIKIYEDEDLARDCTCGGPWCPKPKWKDLSNAEMLVKGLVKQVKPPR